MNRDQQNTSEPFLTRMQDHRFQFLQKKTVRVGMLASLLLIAAIVGLAATYLDPVGLWRDSSSQTNGDGFTAISSGFGGFPSHGESARRADIIVRATVQRSLTSFWDTADGSRPELSDKDLLMQAHTIFTPYELKISEVIQGDMKPGDTITFTVPEGEIGEYKFVNEDGPFFRMDESVLLFLRDGGPARENRMGFVGSRYCLVNKLVIDDGLAVYAGEHTYELDEVLNIVRAEKALEPKYFPPCE